MPRDDSSADPTLDFHRKIVAPDRLVAIVRELRRQGSATGAAPRRVVQCHGCFDIVHPGHIRYLQFARSQGEVLIVSITGDALVDKGAQRPYIPQELRAENLAALELVDWVVIDPNPTACELLRSIRPDVYVKGHEYATSSDPRFLAEREVVETHGGRVIFSSGQVVFSSSRLAEAISPWDGLASARLRLLCRRHDIGRASLSNLLDRIRGARVLVLGDIVVERYVLCDADSVSGESPMMSLRQLDARDHVGGAALIAAQAAALGATPVLVATLGEDERSAWAETTLDAAGIRVHAFPNRPALSLRTRFLVDDHKLFKVERPCVRPLDSVREREVAACIAAEADDLAAVIVYDGGGGTITPGLLRRLAPVFDARVPFVAGESQGNLRSLRRLGLLSCSERQLRTALNDFESGLSTLAWRMLETTQARQMLVTLGKRGLVTFNRPSEDRDSPDWRGRLLSEYIPTFADRVVDRLGCGEALMTAASLACARGAGLMQGAYLGALAAAVQITAPGPAAVSVSRIREQMRRRAELTAPDPCPPVSFGSNPSSPSERPDHVCEPV
ncbi:MAG: adenylyltransferase/cytidyltransferase family protein [Phycisphaerae bacterium]